MAHSYHHAISSARKHGGSPDDTLELHNWMDSSKSAWADQRHRAILHTSFGVFLAEQHFGSREEVRLLRRAIDRVPRWLQRLLGLRIPRTMPVTLPLSNGKHVPIRILAEQHVMEDCGFVPSIEDFLKELPRQSWMSRGALKLSDLLDAPDTVAAADARYVPTDPRASLTPTTDAAA